MTANPSSANGKQSALQARLDAQRIAFGPIVFQVARVLRETGIRAALEEAGSEGATAEALARRTGVSVYGVKVLLESGLGAGLVQQTDEGYAVTLTGHFVLKDEMTRVNMDFVHDVCYEGMHALHDAITSGEPAGLRVFGEWKTVYEALSSLDPRVQESWFRFDHFYSDAAFPAALPHVFERQPKRVLDIGGNTGKWALACLRHDPQVHVAILDLPGQLAKARANVQRAGFEARFTGHALDLLDHDQPYPVGFDVLWMSQFLVCFTERDAVQLLRRAHDAMGEAGRLFIMDTYWDRQRHEVAAFCLQETTPYFACLANGNSRMYRSDDVLAMLAEAELVVEREWDDLGLAHTLWRCRRA